MPYGVSEVKKKERDNDLRGVKETKFWTEGYGEVRLQLTDLEGQSLGTMHLRNTWLAPDLKHNLISIRQLARMGIRTTFNELENVKISQNGKPTAFATTVGNHYYLCTPFTPIKADITEEHSVNATNIRADTKPISISVAHRRTAHASERKLRQNQPTPGNGGNGRLA